MIIDGYMSSIRDCGWTEYTLQFVITCERLRSCFAWVNSKRESTRFPGDRVLVKMHGLMYVLCFLSPFVSLSFCLVNADKSSYHVSPISVRPFHCIFVLFAECANTKLKSIPA
jgi:hypothetical protein